MPATEAFSSLWWKTPAAPMTKTATMRRSARLRDIVVSAEPPMLLACINTRSPACAAIRSNQIFCVNVLSTRQRRLANAFAGNADQGNAYDFSIGQWERGFMDVLRLVDAASSFDCALEQSYDAGSHTIFIGRVTASTGGSFSPLLYTNRNYGFPCQSE